MPHSDLSSSVFAPAYDPFVTASVLHRTNLGIHAKQGISNLYLSPLATKAQVLGFAIYYLHECVGAPVSIVFPFSRTYARETTRGLTRVWKYTVELPARC